MSKNLFPTIVGKLRIREAGKNGEFFELSCATNVKSTINTSENVERLTCGDGDEVVFEKPSFQISATVIKTKNPDLLGKLLDLDVANISAGAKVITNEANTFVDDVIELTHRSNDANGVTTLVVKSAPTGGTTYTATTDYTFAVVDGITKITRVSGGTIPVDATVYISGSVNQNLAKEIELYAKQRTKKQFEVEVFGKKDGTSQFTTVRGNPMTLDSEYILEMLDVFRDGVPQGSELTFINTDGAKLFMRDENL